MATLLSPSPASGSSRSISSNGGGGRRLSELLEEQQEPFSLDLFLLDKGCSPALLDAAGAACWPRSFAATAERAVRRRRRPVSGLLSVILSKILLRGAAAAKKVGGKRQRQPAAAIGDGAGEEEEEDDDVSSKQLSPVSVLEQSPFQPASPAYSKKAIVIFRELLAAAYTPALPDHPANHTPSSLAPAPSTRTGRPTSSSSSAAASHYWEEEKLEAELAKVHDLIAAEMAAGWSVCPVGDARRHVGAELAAAVLEALTEEAAAALILTWNSGRPRCDVDDDAIDDDARCVVGGLVLNTTAGDVDMCLL